MLFAAFSATSEAKSYKWVDEKGETHYGEVVPPEYADKDKKQINEKGREVKKKEQSDDTDSYKNAKEEQMAIEQRRKDKALLSTYSNENEIDLARDRNLQQVEALINSKQELLKSAQESLDGYRKEADVAKKAGKNVHTSLQADIDKAESKMMRLKQDLDKAQEKAASVKASFEADKMRYRELKGSTTK